MQWVYAICAVLIVSGTMSTCFSEGLTATFYMRENGRGDFGNQRGKLLGDIQAPDIENKESPKLPARLFVCARWRGSITPPETGSYVFRTVADEGCRLIVNGSYLIDSWIGQIGDTIDSPEITLQGGKKYEISIEYWQNLGDAYFHLYWKRPGGASFEVIGGEYYSPDIPEAELAVTKIRYYPRDGYASRMLNGRFAGSIISGDNEFIGLATIDATPSEGQWNEILIDNNTVYRYVKYESPEGGWGNIAELEFYHGDTKLTGTSFGTVGSKNNSGTTFHNAFDGDVSSFFDGPHADNQYVGIDLGEASQVAQPQFDPAPGTFESEVFTTISTSTSGAYIRYSIDGSYPQNEPYPGITEGSLYGNPLAISQTSSVIAIAYSPGLAQSVPAKANFTISSEPLQDGYHTYHTGNSLLGFMDNWLKQLAQSVGYKHEYDLVGAAGATTDWLFKNKEDEYEKELQEKAPFDYIIVQPFGGRSIDSETEYAGKFFEYGRTYSPEIELRIYQQWPAQNYQDAWSRGNFSSSVDYGIEPANSWEEAVENHTRYFQILRDSLQAKYPAKPVYIIPVGPAFLKIKETFDNNEFPDVEPDADFFTFLYGDNVHPNIRGTYVAGAMHVTCLYNVNPIGKLSSSGSYLTAAQAHKIHEIVWDVATTTPGTGLNSTAIQKNVKDIRSQSSGKDIGILYHYRNQLLIAQSNGNPITVSLFDLRGRCVYRVHSSGLTSISERTIRLKGASGAHVATVTSGRKVLAKRLIMVK